MPNIRVHQQSTPRNVGGDNNWMITVNGTYTAGPDVQQFDLSDANIGAGRWVLVRANNIADYAGATITNAPSGRTVVGVSQEAVNFSGTTWQCVVVTLA